MTINFDTAAFQKMITNLGKSVTRTPITKTTSNLYGEETLTDGTSETVTAAFFRKEDSWAQDNSGLIQEADAVVLVLPTQTLNKNDKIAYDSETYRVDKVITRRLGTSEFYKAGQCFKIT